MYLAHLYIKFHSPSPPAKFNQGFGGCGVFFIIIIIFSVRHSFVLLSLEGFF